MLPCALKVALASPETVSALAIAGDNVNHQEEAAPRCAITAAISLLADGSALAIVDVLPCRSMKDEGGTKDDKETCMMLKLHPALEEFVLDMFEEIGRSENCDEEMNPNAVSRQVMVENISDGIIRTGTFAIEPVETQAIPQKMKLCIDLVLLHSDSTLFEQALLDCYDDDPQNMCVESNSSEHIMHALEEMPGGGTSRYSALQSIHRYLSGRYVMEKSFIVVELSCLWSDANAGMSADKNVLSFDPTAALVDSGEVAIFSVHRVREIDQKDRHDSIPESRTPTCTGFDKHERKCYEVGIDQSATYSVRVTSICNKRLVSSEEKFLDQITMKDWNATPSSKTSCPGYERLLDELIRLANIKDPGAAPAGILLRGGRGVGKTRMAACVARNMARAQNSLVAPSVRIISANEILLSAASFMNVDALIRYILSPWQGYSGGRKVLIIDDLDAIIDSSDDESSVSCDPERMLATTAIVGAIDALVDGIRRQEADAPCIQVGPPLIMGLCCADRSQIPSQFLRVARFEKVLEMPTPTSSQRAKIFEAILTEMPLSTVDENKIIAPQKWAQALAPRTAGFVASDICGVCIDALTRAQSRNLSERTPRSFKTSGEEKMRSSVGEARVRWADIREAARVFIPSQLARLDVTSTSSFQKEDEAAEEGVVDYNILFDFAWKSFGGYQTVKQRIFRTVINPWVQETEAQDISSNKAIVNVEETRSTLESRIPPPSGIVFHGRPGTGKSFAAICLAASLALPIIKVGASDVLDQWLGGSEAAIRALFARARSAAPCVLFFDDIDAITSNRHDDGDSTNVNSRILSTLLNEMDGVSNQGGRGGVLVVASTNRLASIDSALLRPGRLEEHIELLMPDQKDIEKMLEIHLDRLRLEDDVRLSELAFVFERAGVTGADVKGICTGACLNAIRRGFDRCSIAQPSKQEEKNFISLAKIDFITAQRHIFPAGIF